MLGQQNGRRPLSGMLNGPVMTSPVIWLIAMEGWLMLSVRDALRVDAGVYLSLWLCLASSTFMDNSDGDVARLKAVAAGSWRLVLRSIVSLKNASL